MGFTDAVATGFNKYVTFTGRAARSEFWYWALFNILVSIVSGLVDGLFGLGFISAITSLALLLPSIAVGVRRLHDIDRTGWWLLIAFTGIGAIVLIVFDCIKGTAGPNRFGADPLAAA
jgi:uncharacterized membrane protein YhaH (DUF805 family)